MHEQLKGHATVYSHRNCISTYTSKRKEGMKEMFYLARHSAHFIYGYVVLDIW